jgi:hypothetical protein
MSKEIFFRGFKRFEHGRYYRAMTDDARACYIAWKKFNPYYHIKDTVPDAEWHLPYMRPEPPEDPRTIPGWGLPIEERKFPYLSDRDIAYWEERSDPEHIEHEKYLDFFDEEFRRREEGFFFFNGRSLEYVTGTHYMFMQYWKIPVAKNNRNIMAQPDFRDVHKTVFYCLDTCHIDTNCYGILYYSMRRIGKTAIALCDGFMDTTSMNDQRFAMQSKNDSDARKLFNKMVASWQRLPSWWTPEDTGESTVSKILRFMEPKRKKTSGQKYEYSQAYLNSLIEYKAAGESTLDGEFYSYIINDEVGKSKRPLDVNERWNVNKECLAVGTEIVGFGYVTSTIEDFEKFAAKESEILWDRSDPEQLDPLGRTDSGLYRLFLPAYYGLQGLDQNKVPFMDEWGYTDIKRAYQFIVDMYDFKKGHELLSYRRKYPLTIADSFALIDSGNNYSKERLIQQKNYNLELGEGRTRRGNFGWKDGKKDTEVVFYPDKEGRWEISWLPPKEDRNKFELRGTTQRFPTRDFARMGVDPFDQSYTVDEGSKAAAVTMVKRHMKFPHLDHGIVCLYLHRQQHPEKFFEDMIMQAMFYSSPVLIESNKPGLLEYFRQRGYNGFAMKDPLETDPKKIAKPQRGIPFSGQVKRQDMMDATQAYIYDYIGINEETQEYGWCPHQEVLDDWIKFDPMKWTKYDVSVAAGCAILAVNAEPRVRKVKEVDPSKWIRIPKKKRG